MKRPAESEYRKDRDGLEHVPTGYRIALAYQNVEGHWTLNVMLGNAGEYDEHEVVQLAGRLLLKIT